MRKFDVLPRHIGFIMDGNGRWAKNQGLKRGEGHIAGAKVFKKIGEYCADLGIECVTFYAFSTENWSRPEEEVNGLMDLFIEYLIDGDARLEENKERQMKLKFIGEREGLPEELLELIEKAERETKDYKKITVNIALNYGGRDELVRATRKIAERVAAGELKPEDITEDIMENSLDTAGLPAPDLLIRTCNEQRISNFLLWQLAYTEFYFTGVPWPDFSKEELEKAVEAYNHRDRRYGLLKEE